MKNERKGEDPHLLQPGFRWLLSWAALVKRSDSRPFHSRGRERSDLMATTGTGWKPWRGGYPGFRSWAFRVQEDRPV